MTHPTPLWPWMLIRKCIRKLKSAKSGFGIKH